MNAQSAFDAWEEASIPGLTELLRLIQRAAKNDVQQKLVIGLDKLSEPKIQALRRRGFIVEKRDLVDNQKVRKVEIVWSHAGQNHEWV